MKAERLTIEDWQLFTIVTIHFLAVIRDDIKIDVNSLASFNSGSTSFDFKSFSSIVNSSQKNVSSASSNAILNFDMKLALDCAIQALL